MGKAIGEILPLAIGVAISPLPIIAIVLMLGTILAPLVIYFALGAKAAGILDGIKNWMGAHNAAIMAVLLLVLGVKLIGDAISGLSS
jgi:apolipoprotein N-acyltransferase